MARLAAVATVLAVVGCERSPTPPAVESIQAPRFSHGQVTINWAQGTTIGWHRITDELIQHHNLNAVRAARVWGLVGVAQDAAATDAEKRNNLNTQAAIMQASAEVLAHLFPGDANLLESYRQQNLAAINAPNGHKNRGMRVGRAVANQVKSRANADNSNLVWNGTNPTLPAAGLPNYWEADPTRPVVEPRWREVLPYHLASASQFRPAPPPRYGSAEMDAQLDSVRFWFTNRGPDELAAINFWSGPPASIWARFSRDYAITFSLTEPQTARLFGDLNTAMHDAGIAAWEAKFFYFLPRPPQLDPVGTGTPGGAPLPNHPAYVSGLATWSGAGAQVLATRFPAFASDFHTLAAEAAISRVYSNIHFPIDGDAGIDIGVQIGQNIGQVALARSGVVADEISVGIDDAQLDGTQPDSDFIIGGGSGGSDPGIGDPGDGDPLPSPGDPVLLD